MGFTIMNSVRLSQGRGQIGSGYWVLITFFLFIYAGCGLKGNGTRPQIPVTGAQEKPVVSVDPSLDPLTRVLNLKQDKPSFSIDVWTEKKRYRVGEVIHFHFRSDRDCYVTIIDYETSGAIKVLFPNRSHQSNFIKAGKRYSIFGPESGFEISAAPPAGIERLKAIATIEPFSLFDLDFAKRFFPPVERDNHRDMMAISLALDRLPGSTWTENICTISIR